MQVTGYPLRRVGSGKRMTFTHRGEQTLDQWLADNAFVAWHIDDSPWLAEERLTQRMSLPLNIDGNSHHPFCATLKSVRAAAKRHARDVYTADETGTSRSGQ